MTGRVLRTLLRPVPTNRRAEVIRWWGTLSGAERRTLFAVPRPRIVGRLVEPGSDVDAVEESSADFYDYLVNHEIVLDDGPRFHICTAHPAARAVVREGRIPASFACPNRHAGCPMRALLDAACGNDVVLERR